MLRGSDLSPVKYKRVAEADGKEVPWEEIVKGFEHEKGEFVVVKEEDFKKVNLKSNQTVDIKEFVDLADIDPMFFDEPYFLAPEKGGEKAYSLLRDALKNSKKVGIAKVVIKTREHLSAVKPHGQVLLLELMHFPDELADPAELKLPGTKEVGKKEMQMAESLIDGMSDKWEPAKYKDEYQEALQAVIDEKIKTGGKTVPGPKTKAKSKSNVVDLISVLQESLSQTKGAKKNKKTRRAA